MEGVTIDNGIKKKCTFAVALKIKIMCQTEVISNTVVRLGRRSYTHRMEVARPNSYGAAQLARLNRELDDLYDLIYEDWRNISEADYTVFGGQLVILVKTVKQLYDDCRRSTNNERMKSEVEKLGMNYSALYELNSDIVNFCIKLPKNAEMKLLMQRLTEVDKEIVKRKGEDD